jgi:hypothetical protein
MENITSNYSTESQSSDYIPEKKLWRAVICQALYDALSDLEGKQMPTSEREKAQNWFVYNSGNFKRACECAGFDPDYLSKKVCKLIELKKLKKLGIIWNTRKENILYAR